MAHPTPEARFEASALRRVVQRLGGPSALRPILADFYGRLAQDAIVGFFFRGYPLERIVEGQHTFMLRALGLSTQRGRGPAQAHAALPPIRSGHFNRRLVVLESTLQDHHLDAEEIQVWLAFENAFREMIVHPSTGAKACI